MFQPAIKNVIKIERERIEERAINIEEGGDERDKDDL